VSHKLTACPDFFGGAPLTPPDPSFVRTGQAGRVYGGSQSIPRPLFTPVRAFQYFSIRLASAKKQIGLLIKFQSTLRSALHYLVSPPIIHRLKTSSYYGLCWLLYL